MEGMRVPVGDQSLELKKLGYFRSFPRSHFPSTLPSPPRWLWPYLKKSSSAAFSSTTPTGRLCTPCLSEVANPHRSSSADGVEFLCVQRFHAGIADSISFKLQWRLFVQLELHCGHLLVLVRHAHQHQVRLNSEKFAQTWRNWVQNSSRWHVQLSFRSELVGWNSRMDRIFTRLLELAVASFCRVRSRVLERKVVLTSRVVQQQVRRLQGTQQKDFHPFCLVR